MTSARCSRRMARPVILYVLGPPGVGKTTLVRQLLFDPLRPSVKTITELPDPKWTTVDGRICAAGSYTGHMFDGADRVPYRGASPALDFWAANYRDSYELTIFDGQRFSTKNSLGWLRASAPDHAIIGVHLIATSKVLDDRRAARGTTQNPAWMKGAATTAARFAAMIGAMQIAAHGGKLPPCAATRLLIASASSR